MKIFRTINITLGLILFASGALAQSQIDKKQERQRPVTDVTPETSSTSDNQQAETDSTKKDRQKGMEATEGNTDSSQTAVFLVAPIVMASETGCWATFYDDENFLGSQITLTGRRDLQDVDFDLKPYALGGEPDSLTVGPQATLELYGDEGFQDKDHEFASGQKVPNLKQTPFWDDIESVRLRCSDGSKTAE